MVARVIHAVAEQVSKIGQARRTELIVIAAWFGLITGFLEGVVVTLIRVVPGGLTWQTRQSSASLDIFWVAPAFNLGFFLAVAGVIAVLTRIQEKLRFLSWLTPSSIAVAVFSWLAFFDVFKLPERLATGAVAILALGLVLQVSRWFNAHRRPALAFQRRSLAPLLIAVLLAFIGIQVYSDLNEARLHQNLPVKASQAPNVLLIVLDTLRADHLSAYGYPRLTTPRIDQFAQEGILFEKAYSTSSWTVPGHASLLTGRFVYEHSADSQHPFLDNRYPTIAQVLASKGYLTAAFSANTFWITRNSGFDRGFIHFEDYFGSLADMMARTFYGKRSTELFLPPLGYGDIIGRKRGGDMNQEALSWLDANPGRPFFIFLNYMDVHSPYITAEPYQTAFMNQDQGATARELDLDPPAVFNGSPDRVALWLAAYDGALSFLDWQVGNLLANLERRKRLDKTLVIITSDHGEAFGEHGLFQHGHSLYRELVQVPLILRYPAALPQGVRVANPVSQRDLDRTIMSVLGEQDASIFPGNSLVDWVSPDHPSLDAEPILSEVEAREGVSSALPVSHGWLKSLITAQWHFILHENGQTELYDIARDPKEADNLAATPAGQGIVSGMKQKLEKMISLNGAGTQKLIQNSPRNGPRQDGADSILERPSGAGK